MSSLRAKYLTSQRSLDNKATVKVSRCYNGIVRGFAREGCIQTSNSLVRVLYISL